MPWVTIASLAWQREALYCVGAYYADACSSILCRTMRRWPSFIHTNTGGPGSRGRKAESHAFSTDLRGSIASMSRRTMCASLILAHATMRRPENSFSTSVAEAGPFCISRIGMDISPTEWMYQLGQLKLLEGSMAIQYIREGSEAESGATSGLIS
jgi:hypothetical protein